MSELRPDTPVKRPDTARPRDEEVPQVDPPTPEEIEAVQRHLVTLPGQEGASVSRDEELGLTFVRGSGPGPDVTYAAMPRWTADDWPAKLTAATDRMRAEGTWPSLLLCDRLDRPRGIDDELGRAGWMKVTSETVLWVGHASVVPHLDPLLRIEAVQPATLPRHEALEREIFGIGADQAQRRRNSLTAAIEQGQLRAWIVWLDDEPIAVARLSRGEGVAGLQGIGVVESRRGQGYGTLITTIATRAGMAVGNRIIWLSVEPGNASAMAVYRKLGFAPLFNWTRWLVAEDPRRR